MPKHFESFSEFLELITKHGVAEVKVSHEDYCFLWDRAAPSCRRRTGLVFNNLQGHAVSVVRAVSGTLDLTGDEVKVTGQEGKE